jgi:LysE type translocator
LSATTTAAIIAAIAAGVTLLLRLTEPIATARREVREHNLAALFSHEDVARWVEDENRLFAERLNGLAEDARGRGLQGGLARQPEARARREQAQRWRDRLRAYERTLQRLMADEGSLHSFWRHRAPKGLRLSDWPANERDQEMRNPKIAVFFTSLLPQFVGAHGSAGNLLLLGLLFNAMGVGWLICYATAVARGRNVLVRPRVKRTLDRISGLVLVGLGTRLALENR